ncbi:hypothetical protein Hypma_008952 [Hypsizygus marmoreus]|uniref:Uncharacterized protein n=1 Tax=Hypsizygus marmoreus TaxID=39966 RepID=A0A369JUX6_HYPMA|nr:hypothetical protein Hypma_008952 [Hypsizygus marmoreus]
MKSCLKSPLHSPCSEECPIRKCVAFSEVAIEEVHFADDWDRTPTEPARKLTYQDILELKEIQRSLPRANQLDDPVSGRPGSHFLTAVPIGLLPLLSSSSSSQESFTTSSPVTSPTPTPSEPHSNSLWLCVSPPPIERIAPRPSHPPHLSHLLPSKPPTARPKPSFAFLPLLDTPPTSEESSPYTSTPSSRSPSPDAALQSDTDQSQDPPTPSLTNASLDSSPLSRASSSSPEPPFLQLPPLGSKGGEHNKPHFGPNDEYVFTLADERSYSHHAFAALSSITIDSIRPPRLRENSSRRSFSGRSPTRRPSVSPQRPDTAAWNSFAEHSRRRGASVSAQRPKHSAWNAFPNRCKPRQPSTSPQRTDTPARRRKFMVLNGVEIDIDDDDEDILSPASTPGASSPQSTADNTPAHTPLSPSTPCSSSPPSPDCGRSRQLPPAAKPSSSPILSASPPNRCSKSLCSPIRFKRDVGPKATAF